MAGYQVLHFAGLPAIQGTRRLTGNLTLYWLWTVISLLKIRRNSPGATDHPLSSLKGAIGAAYIPPTKTVLPSEDGSSSCYSRSHVPSLQVAGPQYYSHYYSPQQFRYPWSPSELWTAGELWQL